MTEMKTAIIRSLNDRLRVENVGGRILMTRSIVERGTAFVLRVIRALRAYDQFDAGNDPYDEHDFGALDVEGERLFWKIDYLDPTLSRGASDPSSATECERVMTIMLAEEY